MTILFTKIIFLSNRLGWLGEEDSDAEEERPPRKSSPKKTKIQTSDSETDSFDETSESDDNAAHVSDDSDEYHDNFKRKRRKKKLPEPETLVFSS